MYPLTKAVYYSGYYYLCTSSLRHTRDIVTAPAPGHGRAAVTNGYSHRMFCWYISAAFSVAAEDELCTWRSVYFFARGTREGGPPRPAHGTRDGSRGDHNLHKKHPALRCARGVGERDAMPTRIDEPAKSGRSAVPDPLEDWVAGTRQGQKERDGDGGRRDTEEGRERTRGRGRRRWTGGFTSRCVLSAATESAGRNKSIARQPRRPAAY